MFSPFSPRHALSVGLSRTSLLDRDEEGSSPGHRQGRGATETRGEGPPPGQGITWTYRRQGRWIETHLETVSFRRQILRKHANLTASCLRQATFRTRCCPQHPRYATNTGTSCDMISVSVPVARKGRRAMTCMLLAAFQFVLQMGDAAPPPPPHVFGPDGGTIADGDAHAVGVVVVVGQQQ